MNRCENTAVTILARARMRASPSVCFVRLTPGCAPAFAGAQAALHPGLSLFGAFSADNVPRFDRIGFMANLRPYSTGAVRSSHLQGASYCRPVSRIREARPLNRLSGDSSRCHRWQGRGGPFWSVAGRCGQTCDDGEIGARPFFSAAAYHTGGGRDTNPL